MRQGLGIAHVRLHVMAVVFQKVFDLLQRALIGQLPTRNDIVLLLRCLVTDGEKMPT